MHVHSCTFYINWHIITALVLQPRSQGFSLLVLNLELVVKSKGR